MATCGQLVARRPTTPLPPLPSLVDGPFLSLVAVGMKALDLLVLQCGRKVAECRDQLRDGLGRLLPGHSSPAITDGRSELSAAQSIHSVSLHSRVPLGGSESRLQATGRRKGNCGRLNCPACRRARLSRHGESGDNTLGATNHYNPRERKNPEAVRGKSYKPCRCTLHLADRSASLDTWLERTSRISVRNPELHRNTKVLPVHQEDRETPTCRCVETEHKRQLLRRSKSLHEVQQPGRREGRAGNADGRRTFMCDNDVAASQSFLGTTCNQSVRPQGVIGVSSSLTHPVSRIPCQHTILEAVHPPFHPNNVRQFTSYSGASHPITSSPRGGYTCFIHSKQYHAVGYPPMPLTCQSRTPGAHYPSSSDCHLFGLPGAHCLPPAVTSAEAQRQHVDQEMATRFHLGRSATVDVLEENFDSREMSLGEPIGGCGCLVGPRSPHQSHHPEANWRPRVKSISDPNIPLNVADGGPAAEESNKSVGRVGAARSPPPTRTKRTEIYMELRPPRESVSGPNGGDFSEEENSISFDSSKTPSSSGRQTPLGYAADASHAPHARDSSLTSSRISSQDSLPPPDLVDAATQTPAPTLRSPPPPTTWHATSVLPSVPAAPHNPLEVSCEYLEAVEHPRARPGTGQAAAEEREPQQQQQQHLHHCTCRKVRRVADPHHQPPTSWPRSTPWGLGHAPTSSPATRTAHALTGYLGRRPGGGS